MTEVMRHGARIGPSPLAQPVDDLASLDARLA